MIFGNKAIIAVGLALILLFTGVLAQEISLNNFIQNKNLDIDKINLPFQIQEQEKANFQISEEQKEINLQEVYSALGNSKNEKISILVWVKNEYLVEDIINNLKDFETKFIYSSSNGFSGLVNREDLDYLAVNDKVDYIVLDKAVQGLLPQSRQIVQVNNVENTYNLRGDGIGVCVTDTGIDYTHPNLMQAYNGGYDFINNDADPFDDNGHGTRVSGIIVSNHATNRGMAPNAKIVAVKVLNATGWGWWSTIAAGVDWCVTNKAQFNVSVISMSIGAADGSTYTPTTNPAFIEPSLLRAYNNNIPIVAGSGNSGSTNGITYPAISPYTISVGATYDANVGSTSTTVCADTTTYVDKVACWGDRATFLDLMAPGGRITTTSLNQPPFPLFFTSMGTSLSTPHVSGIIALMLQRNKNLLPSQVKEILVRTGDIVYDNATGMTFPRVNALNAVNAVPYINQTGTFAPNSLVTFHLYDKLHVGDNYFMGLSIGSVPGIPLSDGRIVPLNIDGLFLLSFQPNPLIQNNFGNFDSNGYGSATFFIPDIPGIQTLDFRSAFITYNSTGHIYSVSNSNKL